MKLPKVRMILASAIFACAGMALPAFAQTAQQDLQQYIKSHPELQSNPGLMSNPNYLARHPDLGHWLSTHPNVAPGRYRDGAWDSRYQWHNEDWWHHNDRTGFTSIIMIGTRNIRIGPTTATMTTPIDGGSANGGCSIIRTGSRNIIRVGRPPTGEPMTVTKGPTGTDTPMGITRTTEMGTTTAIPGMGITTTIDPALRSLLG